MADVSKQDRTYSRTPEDLERKYNLGKLSQGGDSKEVEELRNEVSKLNESLEWKSAGQITGTETLTLPTNYNELYIYVKVGNEANGGYIEFSPKKVILKDTFIAFHGGKVAVGDNGKRYSRSATISVSKTAVKFSEVHYSHGMTYNSPDTNVTDVSEMFVFYR